jgi:hypothetical protein
VLSLSRYPEAIIEHLVGAASKCRMVMLVIDLVEVLFQAQAESLICPDSQSVWGDRFRFFPVLPIGLGIANSSSKRSRQY